MIDTDDFPFPGLQNDDFLNEFASSNSSLEPDIIPQMTDNITLNAFSLNGSGKQYLTSSPNTDPGENYFNQFTHCLNDCNYYDETSFHRLTESSQNNILSIAYFNIRSIINKHDDFSSYLASLKHEFSVIGLTETWLTKDNLYDFPMPHYRFVGQVRDTKHGGGIAMYINQLPVYQFTERNDLSIIMENIIEAQFIEINMPTKNILIGIIYRPPKDTYKQFEDKLSAILQIINQENKKCYLMGDFNIDLLKIDQNDNSNSFINLMFSSSFYPTIS